MKQKLTTAHETLTSCQKLSESVKKGCKLSMHNICLMNDSLAPSIICIFHISCPTCQDVCHCQSDMLLSQQDEL